MFAVARPGVVVGVRVPVATVTFAWLRTVTVPLGVMDPPSVATLATKVAVWFSRTSPGARRIVFVGIAATVIVPVSTTDPPTLVEIVHVPGRFGVQGRYANPDEFTAA
jgi:hypothetical protein